jgi:putative NADPH-quinone reductase
MTSRALKDFSNARIPLREHGVRFAHFVRSSRLIYNEDPELRSSPVTNNAYDIGIFKGKSLILVITTGALKEMYSEEGAHGALNKHLESITYCIFEYMVLKVLPSHIIY